MSGALTGLVATTLSTPSASIREPHTIETLHQASMRVAAEVWSFEGSVVSGTRCWHAGVPNHDYHHRRYPRHRLLAAPGTRAGRAERSRVGAIDRTRPRGEGRARDPHCAGPSTVDGRHRATESRVASGYALPSRHAPGRSPTARCTSLVQRHRDQAGRGWRRGRTGSRREGNVTAPAVRRAVGHRRERPERRPGVQRHQPARSRFADVWDAAVRWYDRGRRAGDTADHYPRRVGSRRGSRLPIAAKRAVRLQ